ncbi:MAG: 5'-methylthioadenosine/S-adenosylhomocysteine nucleosidase [Candidatus Margulisbacteria bacterium]|nr:5'-methylthioadenosine/S-adenosylhomocysteine nucleosidase [Candidatus Margulisiibacteriota bacterium]
MRSTKLGVLIAVKNEAAAILSSAEYHWRAAVRPSGQIYHSDTKNIVLAVCGVGKAHTAFALGQIFNEADEVIMFGTSGGLGQEKIGSLYLCAEFVEHDMDATGLGAPAGVTPFSGLNTAVIAGASPDTLARIREICQKEKLTLNTGRSLSGDTFINNKELAAAKAAQFGGQLVDMESAAAAKLCLLRQKPFCAVRYITDNADHNATLSWQENVRISAAYFDRILRQL